MPSRTCPLVGTRFRGMTAQVRVKQLVPGESLFFEREPLNAYDENAIKVLTRDDVWIGYIAREAAAEIAPVFDEGALMKATWDGEDILIEWPMPTDVEYDDVRR